MKVDLDAIAALVGRQLGVERVEPGDQLVEDLGAESADLLNLVAALEDGYGVTIEEEELPGLRTVRDLFERVQTGPHGS